MPMMSYFRNKIQRKQITRIERIWRTISCRCAM
jgi:hypothetical protein